MSCEVSQDNVVLLADAKKERSPDNHAFGLHSGTAKMTGKFERSLFADNEGG